jgi:large subunit ribosomal protein L25
MKSIAISGSARQNVGKRDAKELRYQGLVPAVLYGGKEQTHLSVSAADLKPVLYTAEVVFVELDINGKKKQEQSFKKHNSIL